MSDLKLDSSRNNKILCAAAAAVDFGVATHLYLHAPEEPYASVNNMSSTCACIQVWWLHVDSLIDGLMHVELFLTVWDDVLQSVQELPVAERP